MSSIELKTPLYDLHIENGAKMVPFAGYLMPIQYPLGIIKEHLHTRSKAGLFDVSHMGQAWVTGSRAALELEAMIPIDIVDLEPGQQRYGFFTNDNGGIEDDLMVSAWLDEKQQTRYLLVVNAACKEADFARLEQGLKTSQLEIITDRALIALQGPTAKLVMQRLAQSLDDLPFMATRLITINGSKCYLTRSGYTGEDGFELSVPNGQAEALARLLQADEDVDWIGLGARDTLRLEGGMCLYGHDIDSRTTPVEAALTWALSPARRSGGCREGGFPGADIILSQMGKNPETQISMKRVGLKPSGRAPIREGAELMDKKGNVVGKVTSGGFSPTLQQPIAMGYVNRALSRKGSVVTTQVRKKSLELTVSSPTFVANNFYRL